MKHQYDTGRTLATGFAVEAGIHALMIAKQNIQFHTKVPLK